MSTTNPVNYISPNKRYYIPEVIDLINEAPDEITAANTIRHFSRNRAFLDILRYAFDVRLELFETDVPPYNQKDPNAYGLDPSSLEQEMKRFYIFEKKMTERLTRIRQERNLIEMLEGLNIREAELVTKVFRRELFGKYVNPQFIARVIPGLIPEEYWRQPPVTNDLKSEVVSTAPVDPSPSVSVEPVVSESQDTRTTDSGGTVSDVSASKPQVKQNKSETPKKLKPVFTKAKATKAAPVKETETVKATE